MKNKWIFYCRGLLILAIIVLSGIFHYPIHVVDALTLERVPEYSFYIPLVKIIFEPFFGILLYFNRAVYALEEQQYLLFWTVGLFVIYSIYKASKIKDKKAKKKHIYSLMANVPLLVCLWFAFFLVMLFIPLPNNTIVNNSEHSILVTTHAHSQYSHDGLIRQDALWKWHKRNGFDAFFITDHGTNHETIDFLNTQRNDDFPSDPLVMCGEEYSASNHFSLLGIKSVIDTKGYSDSLVIDAVHKQGGAVIVNHWFDDENESLEYYKNAGVDGFEIENAGSNTSYDREMYQKIKGFCETNNLIMIAGLDFHGYGNVCTMWNALDISGWHGMNSLEKEDAILQIFRSRDQSKLKVLVYKDRPFYNNDNLTWSPFRTIINYFRTLNVWQVLSWVFWLVLIGTLKIKLGGNLALSDRFSTNKVLAILCVISAVFMLVLGTTYFLEIQNVMQSENDLYAEYSSLLFYTGSGFLLYSMIVSWFRFKY